MLIASDKTQTVLATLFAWRRSMAGGMRRSHKLSLLNAANENNRRIGSFASNPAQVNGRSPNPHCCQMRPFLRDDAWLCAFGPNTVTIPESVMALTKASFQNPFFVEAIRFEPGSKLSRLESETFGFCTSLKWLCIPRSVTFIDSFCFTAANRVGGIPVCCITFEAGSRLKEIAPRAFTECRCLESICLPASVERLTGEAFLHSGLTVSMLRMEADSFEPGGFSP
jgi:hypothetical protein